MEVPPLRPFSMSLPLARPDLSVAVQTLNVFNKIYIPQARRTIYQFRAIDKGTDPCANESRSRQIALIWTTDGSDTFTLQYYPRTEAAQIVAELPLSALSQTVAELRQAGF